MTHTKDEALKLALDGQRHLVEILAENWRVWPAQKAVEQTCLGDVYCSTKGRDLMFGNHEIAVDQDSAVVTKEMWSTMRQTLAAQPAPTVQEPVKFEIGGRYNWKGQQERLIYMGYNFSGNGRWHQFAKVEDPKKVWCEVQPEDLSSFESTPPAQPAPTVQEPVPWSQALESVWAEPDDTPPAAQQDHEPENEPFVSLASVQEPVATDWERIARVQDAKLRAMCNDPTAFEQLCEIMDRYEALRPTPPAQPAPVREDWGPGPHEVHSLPAPVQEPVAWTVSGTITDWSKDFSAYQTKHYTRPVYTPPAAPVQEPVNQRAHEIALRQWEHWKQYALELQEKLVKYEGGAPMVLNTTPPAAQQEPVEFEDWHSANYVQPLEKYGDSYKNMHVRNRWQGWLGAKSTPPAAQPAPVPLTDEQIYAIGKELGMKCRLGGNPNIDLDYARAIEAKVFEKNGAIGVVMPDALNPKDENPAYAAGWNDCRAEMLKGMKP
jgi:hypothetical protein